MRTASGFAYVLTLGLLPGSLAYGATVSGTVNAPDGAPFRGAFVQAQNSTTKIMVSVLSDKLGHYRIENLPAGQYRLQVRAVGYRADPRQGVVSRPARTPLTNSRCARTWSGGTIFRNIKE